MGTAPLAIALAMVVTTAPTVGLTTSATPLQETDTVAIQTIETTATLDARTFAATIPVIAPAAGAPPGVASVPAEHKLADRDV